jgi:hypothetical protein
MSKILRVRLLRHSHIQISRLLKQTIELQVQQLETLRYVFWLASAVLQPSWA